MKKLFCLFILLQTFLLPPSLAAQNVTVIGIGRLGLCWALVLEKAGYHVMGVDVSQEYVDKLNQKTFHSPEPLLDDYLRASRHFMATTSLKEGLNFSDTCFILVSTTFGTEAYDFSMLNALLNDINALKISNKNIIISSTLFPGYIKEMATPLLKNCHNITLSYSPPFIAQGEIMQGLLYPDMVLIGQGSPESGEMLEEIFKKTAAPSAHIARMSVPSAEIAKLALNCFITAKIAYANLVAEIADETPGADKFEILKAVGKDSRVGSKYLRPGYGFGGPCFPRDNRALGRYALTKGIDPVIFQATDAANRQHAIYMANQLINTGLEEHVFDGVSYKPESSVNIIEESQKLAVAKIVAEKGKKVTIVDREEIIQLVRDKHGNLFNYRAR